MASAPGLGWPGQPDRRRQPDRPESGTAAPAGGASASVSDQAARRAEFPAGLGWPGGGIAVSRPAPSAGQRTSGAVDGPAGSTADETARGGEDGPAVPSDHDEAGPARRMRQVLSAAVSRETDAGDDRGGTPAMREGETDMTENLVRPRAEREVHDGGAPAVSGPAMAAGRALSEDSFRTAGDPAVSGSGPGPRGRGDDRADVVLPALREAAADTPIARAAQAALVARAGGPAWPRPVACRILTIANQKGGVGKTTTAVNLAASLALHGSRVLVVDLDPQGNASTALDVDHHTGIPSVYNVLVDDRPLAAIIRPVEAIPLLYCAPATIDLAGAEIELVPLVARESRLSRALGRYDVSDLDYILIDCPPSLGLLTVNALVAAPEVLIPIQCEYYALEGLEQLLRTVNLVKSHLNPALAVSTILLTMYDARTRLASQVADEVREHFGGIVLHSVIPRSVRVSEAPSYGQSVMTYDPGSSGAVAYLEAAKEMAYRGAPAGR
jgi:chromosome partitioning protein